MARLHAFNPDTEYALASNRRYYTPPAHVVEVRRRNALLPAIYAEPGDAILLLDTPDSPIEALPYHDLAADKGLKIYTPAMAAANRERLMQFRPEPWGWNASMRQTYLDAVGEMHGLPTPQQIVKIRELSHRRTTIAVFERMRDCISQEISTPREIFDADECVELWRRDRRIFFKAPWSSSGRGIMLADDLEEQHVRPWVTGIISRQGSVLAETAYRRKLDFATEWLIDENGARFLGYSVFNVSRRGKYHSNVRKRQDELREMITETAPLWNEELLTRQKDAIEAVIAPHYRGNLGIDMLVTESGAINPCVEINLRHTMGEIELYI